MIDWEWVYVYPLYSMSIMERARYAWGVLSTFSARGWGY
jgi:hypothetical protein